MRKVDTLRESFGGESAKRENYLDASIFNFIESCDARLNKRLGWQADYIAGYVSDLLNFGKVEVGRRATCGKVDNSQFVYSEWLKIVARFRKKGCHLLEEGQKHKNGWATKAGGFWESTIYIIVLDDNDLETGHE